MAATNPDTIPRYQQPMDPEHQRMCESCCYCKDLFAIAVCVYEVFQSDTFDELSKAEIYKIHYDSHACSDYKEDK